MRNSILAVLVMVGLLGCGETPQPELADTPYTVKVWRTYDEELPAEVHGEYDNVVWHEKKVDWRLRLILEDGTDIRLDNIENGIEVVTDGD
jgi:hypothetical protein